MKRVFATASPGEDEKKRGFLNAVLADAGFMFASEILYSTRRWWGVPNIDASIKDKVLADYDLWVVERQR